MESIETGKPPLRRAGRAFFKRRRGAAMIRIATNHNKSRMDGMFFVNKMFLFACGFAVGFSPRPRGGRGVAGPIAMKWEKYVAGIPFFLLFPFSRRVAGASPYERVTLPVSWRNASSRASFFVELL